MTTGFFDGISKATYQGSDDTDPIAFHHYDADEMIEGKRMEDHPCFAVADWGCIKRTICGLGHRRSQGDVR